jgi:L,D-transpeptidase catalytic domain/Putative peptidoglycan binding domain
LVDAVKRFQGRHGLETDGVIGAGTIKALNVTLAQRVRQIELAMERMRWLPKLDDRPNVFVNVPLFRMWATDPVRGDEPLRMSVVVGQSLNHRTPLFIEQMEYVIFRLYWNPPMGITVKELIPHARRDRSGSRSSSFPTPRTCTCTARPPRSCSRERVATSAMGASVSKIQRASASGCSATSRSGPGSGSTRRCRASDPHE